MFAACKQRQEYSLVDHPRKEAVNGEAVSLLGTGVYLLVGIMVRHALTGNGHYDLVRAHVQRYATVILRSVIGTQRHRPKLPRRRGVKVEGVLQIIAERPRTASRRKTIPLEGGIDRVGAHHTDVMKVP